LLLDKDINNSKVFVLVLRVKYVFVPQVLVKFGISPSSKFLTNLVIRL